MKTFTVALLVGIILLLGGCSSLPATNHTQGGINHIILLWLHDPGNPRQQQQIIDATKSLENIPGVIKIRVGTTLPSERKIVDSSFDIGIHMLFSDQQAMADYISHPDHVSTVGQAIMPLVKRIQIYDFVEP